jgi:hypothetical protein
VLLGAMGACVGDDGGQPVAAPIVPEDGVGKMGLRRLTVAEYDNTVAAILGDDTRPGAALLPEDARSPFDNDYTTQEASRVLVEAAETLAKEAAARLVAEPARRDAVVGCTPSAIADAACMASFVGRFGRLALRRPLSQEEIDAYVALGLDFAERDGTFDTGVEVVIRAFLQDGELLYRVEIGTAVPERPGLFRLNGWERATRMSYFLWGGPPDDALLDLAAAGSLETPEGMAAAAEAMLADGRTRAQVERFHALWLGFDQLPHAQDLTNRMRAETAALIERVVFDERRSWLGLFDATESFVDDTLAQHYGMPSPGSSTPVWTDYGDSGRRGLLSHGSFLSVAGNVADTSPTKRGKLIRERLMCQVVPPPPPDVDADAPPDEASGECKWDRYAAHRQAGACKSCHDMMDPIGFGLENFDREGRFRAHDDGAPQCAIAGDGELVGAGTFNGPAELGALLMETGRLEACAAQQLYQYAMGHPIGDEDDAFVTALQERFREGGQRFDRLLVELVANPAFGFRLED